MSFFTDNDMSRILDAHKTTKHALYKSVLNMYVDEAVDYYETLLVSERGRIYGEIMHTVSTTSAPLTRCNIIIKKAMTFKARADVPGAKAIEANMAWDHMGEGGYFGNPTVNIYSLYKHTDFAKKLAARLGDRFKIHLTAYRSDDDHESLMEFTNILFLVMDFTVASRDPTQITY